MATPCHNEITLTGGRIALDEMYDALRGGSLAERVAGVGSGDCTSLLETFLPLPECLEGTGYIRQAPYPAASLAEASGDPARLAMMQDANLEHERSVALALDLCGYPTEWSWTLSNWGPSHPDCVTDLSRRARSVKVSTTTELAPPLPALEILTGQFPVTGRCWWKVEGRRKGGRAVYRNGYVVERYTYFPAS